MEKAISERLRELREKRGLTQTEVASAINTSRANYAKMESGERDLKTDHCIALADFFDVSCDRILRGVDTSHVDAHRKYGLSGAVLQLLENETHICDSFRIPDMINALLEDEIDGVKVLHRIYEYLFSDYSTPCMECFESELPLCAYYTNDRGKKTQAPTFVTGLIIEEACLELVKNSLRELKQKRAKATIRNGKAQEGQKK